MRMITGSTGGRGVNLSGLPALILGGIIAATIGVFLMLATVFGVIVVGIRAALGGLLRLFGAHEPAPRATVSESRPDTPNTIEMRRDDRGSWRRE